MSQSNDLANEEASKEHQEPTNLSENLPEDELAPIVREKLKGQRRLKGTAWIYVAKRSLHEFSRNKCTDLAASLTYYTMLSIFPGLLAVVSLLGVVGQAEETTNAMLGVLEGFASEQVVETLRQPIEQLTSAPSAGFALVAGLLGSIWSASGYVGAFGRALNKIYGVEEGRPFLKLKPMLLLVTLVMLVAAALMAALFVLSGPVARSIGSVIGLGESALMVWNIAKWPVMLLFAVMIVAVLYYGTPNIRHSRVKILSVGALIALVVLGAATSGFFFYVSNFANYNKTYGAIGGVIVLLLWIWIANLSLLFGAVVDAELERGHELQTGIKAERTVQLEMREDTGVLKAVEKEEKVIREGRQLRYSSEVAAEQSAERQVRDSDAQAN